MFRTLNYLLSSIVINGLGWAFPTQMEGNRESCSTTKNDFLFLRLLIPHVAWRIFLLSGIYNSEFLKTRKGKKFQESNYFCGEMPQNFFHKMKYESFFSVLHKTTLHQLGL